MAKSKKKINPKDITVLDLMPRDPNVVGMIGKSRKFENKKRQAKADKAGRKAKHKGN